MRVNVRFYIYLIIFTSITGVAFAQTNTFPSSGNVGIGTTNPGKKLEVVGNAVIEDGNGFGAWSSEFGISKTQSGIGFTSLLALDRKGIAAWRLGVGNGYQSNAFSISKDDGGTTIPFTILSNDNVGIGTTSPQTKLNLVGGTLQIGKNTDSYYNTLTSNTLEFYRPSASSYIDQSGIGGALLFRTSHSSSDDTNAMLITSSGNVGIGTTSPTAKLAVNGTAKAKEMIVTNNASDWPDYVFKPGYKKMSLDHLAAYIKTKKHLPGIPTQSEIEQRGQDIGVIQAKLLGKIEELTLITLKQQKLLEEQEKRIELLEKKESQRGPS